MGLLVAGTLRTSPGQIAGTHVPWLYLNRQGPGARRYVCPDDGRAAQLAVNHLIELGHRRNLAETLAAREKQELIAQRFAGTVRKTRARSACLANEYNRRFNSVLSPGYDGGRLPGLHQY